MVFANRVVGLKKNDGVQMTKAFMRSISGSVDLLNEKFDKKKYLLPLYETEHGSRQLNGIQC